MKKIILDTNFFTIPHQFKIDIFEEIDRIMEEEYELITLNKVVEELKKLAKEKTENAVAARIGLEMIKKRNIKIISTEDKNVDNTIFKIADKNMIVATNDRVLRKKLKNKNVKTLYLRSEKYIEMD